GRGSDREVRDRPGKAESLESLKARPLTIHDSRAMSNVIEVQVPDIGEFKDIPVIEVLVKPGDRVKAEDSLLTLESDKATMEVPSPAAGVVKEIRIKVGDKVSQGAPVLTLETGDGAAAPAPAAPKAASAPEPRPAAQAAPA